MRKQSLNIKIKGKTKMADSNKTSTSLTKRCRQNIMNANVRIHEF